jgi:acyl carrier protein
MTRQDFTREFAEIINANAEDLRPETEMSNLEGWDSVTYLAAMVLVDEKLSVKLRPDMLSRARTFGDILSAVGSALED